MLQEDSIIVKIIPARPQTPYQVLRLLPKDATPAQQDSAIQAWFKPGDIHYSNQPDTLHLPGESIPRDLKEVNLPQYYRENYFSKDSLYHPELEGGRPGIAGDPIPYTIQNDHFVTSILLLCFLVFTYASAKILPFITKQVKGFFNPLKAEELTVETGAELRIQLLFVFIVSLLYAILFYFYATHYIANTFILESNYALMAFYWGACICYFSIRAALYSLVNNVFFTNKKNLQFLGNLLFITAFEIVLIFPLVLLLAYFHFSIENAIVYTALALIFVKSLTFYKAYTIFFKQKEFFLQIILYFCALEMTPLGLLWSSLVAITNILKINF
jgi:hypothetical protein